MNDSISDELQLAARAIAAAPIVALACHVTPDGDALGSMLAMHHLCEAAGKPNVMSWPEPFEAGNNYRSMPGLGSAVPPVRFLAEPPVMATFDCGSLARLNELAAPASHARNHGELIVVDHHASNNRYGTINAVDENAAATAVVVRELARTLGWPLNRDAAWCLYTGLVTDTGRFQYATTTPAVFSLAEELASFGLPVAQLSRELFEEHRFAYLQLAGRALSRATLVPEIRFVSTFVSQRDLDDFGVGYQEIEGLIDWVRSTAEAEVACVCKEAPDGIRVSLRAISSVDVGAIATSLGGGGHRLAAGFTMTAPIDRVLAVVRDAVQRVSVFEASHSDERSAR